MYTNTIKNNKMIVQFSIMSNLQNHYHFKLVYQKVDQHNETIVLPQVSDRLAVQFYRHVSLPDHPISWL